MVRFVKGVCASSVHVLLRGSKHL
ncbi:hypothetical protein CBM2587_A150086 [Cupriavidus taiwanensis]|uniref:Uncharacterized protein n=1 Tax=Cupriavidus taiwanensis TaxID=164546 RepID=A0A975ZYI4_9BURK|nr:hypothetical protein CBM2587_A150086 [Cupriavidus taiwanensis]